MTTSMSNSVCIMHCALRIHLWYPPHTKAWQSLACMGCGSGCCCMHRMLCCMANRHSTGCQGVDCVVVKTNTYPRVCVYILCVCAHPCCALVKCSAAFPHYMLLQSRCTSPPSPTTIPITPAPTIPIPRHSSATPYLAGLASSHPSPSFSSLKLGTRRFSLPPSWP